MFLHAAQAMHPNCMHAGLLGTCCWHCHSLVLPAVLCQVASSCHPQLGCQSLQNEALQRQVAVGGNVFLSSAESSTCSLAGLQYAELEEQHVASLCNLGGRTAAILSLQPLSPATAQLM